MLTCHSDFGKLKTVFIKHVNDAFVNDKTIARDWQALNYLAKPNLENARGEYTRFEGVLRDSGAKIHYFSSDEETSMDSIYCRDASIATNDGSILCRMGKPARESEPESQRKAFESHGIKVLGSIVAPGTVEGGDVAWIDTKTLAVGHTYRTNLDGIKQLRTLLAPLGITVLVVPLPHYKGPTDVFHLMSILSPVDHDLAVVYSPLMPIGFRSDLLLRGYQLIEVPESEFDSMGCNVLALGPRDVLIVSGNPKTRDSLIRAGCKVTEYEGGEISIKGGGGPTCLTRPLTREV